MPRYRRHTEVNHETQARHVKWSAEHFNVSYNLKADRSVLESAPGDKAISANYVVHDIKPIEIPKPWRSVRRGTPIHHGARKW